MYNPASPWTWTAWQPPERWKYVGLVGAQERAMSAFDDLSLELGAHALEDWPRDQGAQPSGGTDKPALPGQRLVLRHSGEGAQTGICKRNARGSVCLGFCSSLSLGQKDGACLPSWTYDPAAPPAPLARRASKAYSSDQPCLHQPPPTSPDPQLC